MVTASSILLAHMGHTMLTVRLDGNPAHPISATKGEHKLEAEGGGGQAAEGQEPSHRELFFGLVMPTRVI